VMEVCLPGWLLGLLAVGAVGTGVLRQIAEIRRCDAEDEKP